MADSGTSRFGFGRWAGWRRPALTLAAFALINAAAIGAGLTLAYRHLGPLPQMTAPALSPVALDRKGHLLRAFTTPEGRWRLPVTPDEVDPLFLKMLLAYEDQRYWLHSGVDPRAVARAIWQFVKHGRIVSGASTLTMQVARLIEPREAKSLSVKLRQMLRAIQLEEHLTKREILTLYLRLAPYGGNLEGVRAASLAYFGKEPRRLAPHEAALLVALPQSPETRRPDRTRRATRRARNRVLARARVTGLITEGTLEGAKSRPTPKRRRDFPKHAAHLAREMRLAAPKAQTHRLTIDRDLQKALEILAKDRANALGPKHSVAILVMDHTSGDVLAHIGSAAFLDETRAGHVDMTTAVRSPGSTLKPIIYGLAFDAGLAHPETLIDDRPTRFGSYAPRNFNKAYQGTVTVREALKASLNVPAVKLLEAVGPVRLASRLKHAGAPLSLPQAVRPGLPIALGGVGFTLRNLASLYAGIARGGRPITMRYRLEGARLSQEAAPTPLLSPVAAWYVSDILSATPPPANAGSGRLAYKTGTSYGYRDAWAVGFDGKHTIAVWVGRPDGTPSPGLSGILTAAPILHDAAARLPAARVPLPRAPRAAIVASTAKLPPRLRHFGDETMSATAPSDIAPKIAFPPDGAEVAFLPTQTGLQALAFKAEGGRLPLTWFANGVPLSSAARERMAFWRPDGQGFVRVTVMDRAGRTDSVSFKIAAAQNE